MAIPVMNPLPFLMVSMPPYESSSDCVVSVSKVKPIMVFIMHDALMFEYGLRFGPHKLFTTAVQCYGRCSTYWPLSFLD